MPTLLFFEVIDFEFLEGSPETALNAPDKVVITKSTAAKYFGEEDPMGKYLEIQGTQYKISGLLRDVPRNSHLKFNLIVSIERLRMANPQRVDGDGPNAFYSYIRIRNEESRESLQDKLSKAIYEIGSYDPNGPVTWDLVMMPITDIHLYGHAEKELAANSNGQYVDIFSTVAVLVLVIASFNYANLSLVQSSKRAKEVGMRKVFGARNGSIFRQFLIESFAYTLVSLLIAFVFVLLLLPKFNLLTDKSMTMDLFGNYDLLYFVCTAFFLIAFLSGFYPSFLLSKTGMLRALKANFLQNGRGSGTSLVRKGLIVFQFCTSIFLIIGILTINKQLSFIQNKTLGFDKEQILVVELPGRGTIKNIETIKNEMLKNQNVLSISPSSTVPGRRIQNLPIRLPHLTSTDTEGETDQGYRGMRVITADEDYGETYTLEIVEGRDLSTEIVTDAEQGFLINERAVKTFELDDPIGKPIWYVYGLQEPKKGKIVGVFRDYHHLSLHSDIDPVVITVFPPMDAYLSIKLSNSENIQATINQLSETWSTHVPKAPFDYFFLDSFYDSQYKTESSLSRVLSYFTVLALVIASMGLFGLSSFLIGQKTKEIGVRKVLGAPVTSIMKLLSKEFVILLIISTILSWVPAYLFLSNWLNGFAYRIDIPLWLFPTAGLLALLIAIVTISSKTLKAAIKNPVESLRYE